MNMQAAGTPNGSTSKRVPGVPQVLEIASHRVKAIVRSRLVGEEYCNGPRRGLYANPIACLCSYLRYDERNQDC